MNSEVIMYRLDAIERRLDIVEKHMHNGSTHGNNPDLVKILLDLVKNGNGNVNAQAAQVTHAMQAQPQHAKAAVANVVAAATSDESTSKKSIDSFDTLACMARRRTVV